MSAPDRNPEPDNGPDNVEEDRTVCFCHCVPLSDLRKAIDGGARSFEELQAQTACSTGCGGCEWDVREVLSTELAKTAVG